MRYYVEVNRDMESGFIISLWFRASVNAPTAHCEHVFYTKRITEQMAEIMEQWILVHKY